MLTLLFIAGLVPHFAFAAEPRKTVELDTEFAYLTRLAPFVDWPVDAFSSPESPLEICVVATDPLTGHVPRTAIRQMDGRRQIRLRVASSSDSVGNCQILYLGAESDLTMQIARKVERRPVLTVSRSGAGEYATAMIVFVVDHGRVRFDIDDATAASSGLAISSKLLALARNVNVAPQTQ